MIQIPLGAATRRLTTVRQVAHVTSMRSNSVWACAVCAQPSGSECF